MFNKKVIVVAVVSILLFLGIYAFAGGDGEEIPEDNKDNQTEELNEQPAGNLTDEEEEGEGTNVIENVPQRTTVERTLSYTIVVNGEKEIKIEVGTPLEDVTFSAIDSEGNAVTEPVLIVGDVDFNTPGPKTLRYRIGEYEGEVTVTVQDTTKPEITLLGDTTVYVEVKTSYTDAGATALDNYYGDLTSNIEIVNLVDINTIGTYTVTYNVTDESGNKANEVIRTVIVQDTTIPVIDGVEDKGYYNDNVTVTVIEDNIDTITANGNEITLDETNNYTFTDEDIHIVVVTDKGGNSTTKTFTIDKTAPVITVNNQPVKDFYNVSHEVIKVTDSNLKTVVGKADGALFVNEEPINGEFSKTVSLEKTYEITATDKAGNSTTITFTNDRIMPIINGIEDGASYRDNVLMTIKEKNVASVTSNDQQISIDGLKQYKFRDEGDYRVVVTDKAGNSTTKTFTIDKTAPVITVNNQPVKDFYNVSHEVIKVTDSNLKTVVGKADGALFVNEEPINGEFSKTVSLEKTYEITATDKAGNSTTITFTNDRIMPIINGIEDGASYRDNVLMTIKEKNVASVTSNDQQISIDGLKQYKFRDEGDYRVVVTDKAGNSTTKTFAIDKSEPNFKVDGNPKTWTNEDVTLTINASDNLGGLGLHTEPYSFDGGVNWQSSSIKKFYKNQNVNIQIRDKAYNTCSGTIYITKIDKEAPIVTINGEKNIYLQAGIDEYKELGSSAIDNSNETSELEFRKLIEYYDNDLKKWIKMPYIDFINNVQIGKHKIWYYYRDSAGNEGNATRYVYVQDTKAPTITLNPNFSTVYEQGSIEPEWKDAITYTDNLKQDLTLDINTNNIDMDELGNHTITYTVTETEATNWDGSPRPPLYSTYELNIRIVETKPQRLTFFDKRNENQEDIGSAWENVKAQKGQTYEDWVYARSYDEFDDITYIVGADKECINGKPCYEVKYKLDKYDETTSLITIPKVDLGKPGAYQIKYRVYDKTGHSNYRYRWVDVVDKIKPVVTYNDTPNIRTTFEYYEVNNNTGFTGESPFIVIDDIDGELEPFKITFKYAPTWDKKSGTYSGTKTDKIDFAVPGVYRIDYFYKDKSNNDIYATRWIFIEGNNAPVLTVPAETKIKVGGAIDLRLGVSAHDQEDGDMTNKIIINPTSIDTNVTGTYTITYNVSDKYGNKANEVTRTIIVEPNDNFIFFKVSYYTITDNNDIIIKAHIGIDGDTTGYEFQYKWHTQANIQENSITNKLDLTNLVIAAGNKNETFLWIKATKQGTNESRIFLAEWKNKL
ncbi:MAG: DUF5011 domain-containing protein [Bacilli bacterium]|nr:DUF5011 domain-containing protein [Bacilli bacterium]